MEFCEPDVDPLPVAYKTITAALAKLSNVANVIQAARSDKYVAEAIRDYVDLLKRGYGAEALEELYYVRGAMNDVTITGPQLESAYEFL